MNVFENQVSKDRPQPVGGPPNIYLVDSGRLHWQFSLFLRWGSRINSCPVMFCFFVVPLSTTSCLSLILFCIFLFFISSVLLHLVSSSRHIVMWFIELVASLPGFLNEVRFNRCDGTVRKVKVVWSHASVSRKTVLFRIFQTSKPFGQKVGSAKLGLRNTITATGKHGLRKHCVDPCMIASHIHSIWVKKKKKETTYL